MKIGFVGTMSTGKTSLVKELTKNKFFEDYDICVERSQYLEDRGVPLNGDSTLKGQTVFMAERALELMEKNVITDRTVIDVIAFTNTSSCISDPDKLYFKKLYVSLIKEYDVLFYLPPVIKLVKNGVRNTDEEYRKIIDTEIIKIIETTPDLGVHKIESTKIKDRVEEVLEVIKNDHHK